MNLPKKNILDVPGSYDQWVIAQYYLPFKKGEITQYTYHFNVGELTIDPSFRPGTSKMNLETYGVALKISQRTND